MKSIKTALIFVIGLGTTVFFGTEFVLNTPNKKPNLRQLSSLKDQKRKAPRKSCFTLADNAELKFELVQAVHPPIAKEGLLPEKFEHYPATGFSTQKVGRIQTEFTEGANSELRYPNYLSLWSNFCVNLDQNRNENSLQRCANVRKHKGNHYPRPLRVSVDGRRVEVRPAFTSYQAANYCTLAQAAHLLGYDESTVNTFLDKGELQGFYREDGDAEKLAKYHRAVEVPFASVTKQYFVDLCILKKRQGANPKGVFLDYEVGDHRPNQVTVKFLKEMRELLNKKNKELVVWTNNLERSARRGVHGIDRENLPAVLELVHAFGFAIHNGADVNGYESKFRCSSMTFAESLTSQWKVVREAFAPKSPPAHKFLPLAALFDLNEYEAKALHLEIRRLGLKGIRLWRHGARLGGSCNEVTNKVLACLAFGAGEERVCDDKKARVPCGKNGLTCSEMQKRNLRCE